MSKSIAPPASGIGGQIGRLRRESINPLEIRHLSACLYILAVSRIGVVTHGQKNNLHRIGGFNRDCGHSDVHHTGHCAQATGSDTATSYGTQPAARDSTVA